MAKTNRDLSKLVYDSGALSIWNRKTGPIFWYVIGTPGPFYLNTELMIGRALAEQLLTKITAIVKGTEDLAARAKQLNEAILGAYETNDDFHQIIDAMVEKAKVDFAPGSYTAVSGGERRDWLFSIPFAKAIGIKHAFLFKNKTIYCEQSLKPGEKVLHVADLINNAASYFDAWFPILEKSKLHCMGTLCVNTRGPTGVKKLEDAGYKVVAINNIDFPFFEQSYASGLIDKETRDEIAAFFTSGKDWGAKYIMRDPALYDVNNLDEKSFERLQIFFTNDPWGLRSSNQSFFDVMKEAIAARKRKQLAS